MRSGSTEWSEIINIPVSTLYHRFKNGWNVEKTFETPIIISKRNKTVKNEIEYKGEIKCIAEWCRILKMPTSTFHNRIRRGWSLDKIIETPIQKQTKKEIKI